MNALSKFFAHFKGSPVTLGLFLSNTAVFLAMTATGINPLSPDGDALISWGSNFGSLTLNGEWWRLLTNCFLHFGLLHLAMNLYALSYIGIQLERRIGSFLFLSGYLLCGVFASVCSLWWHNGNMNSAGASGAIFGLFGIFYGLLFTNLFGVFQKGPLFKSFLTFLGLNLMFGLQGGIDNSAHIGGLVFGLICGGAYYPVLRRRVAHLHGIFDMEPKADAKLWPALAVLCLALAAFAGSRALIDRIPRDLVAFIRHIYALQDLDSRIERNAERFDRHETDAQRLTTIRQLIADQETILKEIEAMEKVNQMGKGLKIADMKRDQLEKLQHFKAIEKALENKEKVLTDE